MNFIEWCDLILIKLIELSQKDSTVRSIGVNHWQFTEFMLEGEPTILKEDNGSTFHNAIVDAVTNLQDLGLVEQDSQWKVTRTGRTLATDMLPLWWNICQEKLEPEHQQLLHVVNRLSPHSEDGYAWVEGIAEKVLTAELGWFADPLHLESVAKDLEQWGYVSGLFVFGGIKLAATYRGLVWEMKQGYTLMSRLIDDLVAEWETTSVDFKRELRVDTADEKAEFIVDYRDGRVGMLEVLRDPKKLPCSVAKSIGDRKRIEQGDIFVRHGSQVEKPTTLELQALQDEGDQARLAA